MFSLSRYSLPLTGVPISYRGSTGRRLFSHTRNTRNYSHQSNVLNDQVLGNRETIPNKELHPSIKKVAEVVKYQNLGRFGGAVLYPAISLLSIIGGSPSYIFLYTPVCVGLHHLAVRNAYQVGKTLISDGCITKSDDLNESILKKIKNGNDPRFYINLKGDLILNINGTKKTNGCFLEQFDGISLSTKNPNPLINSKILPHRDSNNSISYFHLTPEIQSQANRVLEARRRRFRYPMMLGLAGSFLGGISGLSTEFFNKWYYFSSSDTADPGLAGAVIGLFTNANGVKRETEKLWKILDSYGGIKNIISPEFSHEYRNLDEDLYLKVSTFGNIDFSTEKSISLRNTHLLKKSTIISEE